MTPDERKRKLTANACEQTRTIHPSRGPGRYLAALARAASGGADKKLSAPPPDVRARTFARWLGDATFRRELGLILRATERRGSVALTLAATRAALLLAADVDEGSTLTAARRKACVDVVRLARLSRPVRVSSAQRPRAADATPAEAHPDLDAADAAALLEALGES